MKKNDAQEQNKVINNFQTTLLEKIQNWKPEHIKLLVDNIKKVEQILNEGQYSSIDEIPFIAKKIDIPEDIKNSRNNYKTSVKKVLDGLNPTILNKLFETDGKKLISKSPQNLTEKVIKAVQENLNDLLNISTNKNSIKKTTIKRKTIEKKVKLPSSQIKLQEELAAFYSNKEEKEILIQILNNLSKRKSFSRTIRNVLGDKPATTSEIEAVKNLVKKWEKSLESSY